MLVASRLVFAGTPFLLAFVFPLPV
jgi:hypothetical protein